MFSKQYFNPQYFSGQFFSPTSEIEETARSGAARLALHFLQEESNRKRQEKLQAEKPQTVPQEIPKQKVEPKKVVKFPKAKPSRKVPAEKEPEVILKPIYRPVVQEQNEILVSAASNISAKTEWDRQMLEVALKKRDEEFEDEFLPVLLMVA